MLAYGMHLLGTIPGLTAVEIHPDGEHAKTFDIPHWLSTRGFVHKERRGSTSFGGKYILGTQTMIVEPRAGRGDVVAKAGAVTIVAECKGGIVNTRHNGQKSRLRKGLLEAVGQLMATAKGGRQVAVVPYTETTVRFAKRLAARASAAGIEIALVGCDGSVSEVQPES